MKAADCDDPRDVAGYVTRSGKDECWHPRGSPALGNGDGGRDRGEDHEASSLVQQFVRVVALAAQAVHAFDPPFEDGMESEWWQRVLREGFELQRDGYDVWQLTEQMEARIVARHDEPYELAALRWLDGLRRTWHENSEAGLEPQWGPAPEGEADYFVEDTELTMRDYWVHEARPPSCLAEGRKRKAEAARQERSRTPQRNLETGAKPQEQEERRSLLAGRVTGDGDMTSFVVKKFLLKKKDSRSLRRLVDNPEAWRKGPGVTVTASTRVLAPRAPERGRASGSRGGSTPTACAVAPRGRGRGSSGDRPILVDDGEDDEEMDALGASFLWRSLLGLETDSDYENEEADRMPGFVNEPAYSTVYETLADQPPQAFAAMQESLPRFVELLHNDLQAIVDRVGAERGIGSSAAATRGDDEAAATAPPAESEGPRPGGTASRAATTDGAVEGDEEVEIEIEGEDDEGDDTLLVQLGVQRAGGENKDLYATLPGPHRRLLQLRDWAEDKWMEGHQVADMLSLAWANVRRGTTKPRDLERAREWFELVACVIPRPLIAGPEEAVPEGALPPQQHEWAEEVARAIHGQILWEQQEAEPACMMQRSLTGMTRAAQARPQRAEQMNAELQQMQVDAAQVAAAELLQIITEGPARSHPRVEGNRGSASGPHCRRQCTDSGA